MTEKFEVIDDGPRWTKREALHNKAIGYSFIFGMYGIVAGLLAVAAGYSRYSDYFLFGGFIPFVFLVGPVIIYTCIIRPHKVGKYVLQHKQLPDDM